jgi:hypothetical protein
MPANNHVAAVFAMTVLAKVFAFKLKFDPHWLPLVRSHLALRPTIRESSLNDLNHVAELFGYHSEQEDNTLFVHGLMTKTAKINGIPVDWTTLQLPVSMSGSSNRRGALLETATPSDGCTS